MSDTIVAGIGMIPFGRYPDRTIVDMGSEAALLALRDAGISPGEVGMGFFSNVLAGRLFGDYTIGQNVFWEVGINRIPVFNVENACTSGSSAFCLAHMAIAAGETDVALVVGSEKTYVPGFGLINSGATEVDTQLGMAAPVGFALRARRHMEEFGTTAEQLAKVAVKNRSHAAANPVAQFREPVTLAEVLASPMIVDPFTRLQCCPNADGAAAVILARRGALPGLRDTVAVRAAVMCTGNYDNPQDFTFWETDRRGCATAYERAGIGPEDVDVVECHDAFTIAELLHYEALGLCRVGESGRLIDSGATKLGGRVPVNVSGGLLSRGHPPGATGLAQVFEIVTQLRHQAGSRQVENAQIGVAHCMGGDKASDAKSCTVLVLARDWGGR
jgi:acetyl-CoA acetyltransferase